MRVVAVVRMEVRGRGAGCSGVLGVWLGRSWSVAGGSVPYSIQVSGSSSPVVGDNGGDGGKVGISAISSSSVPEGGDGDGADVGTVSSSSVPESSSDIIVRADLCGGDEVGVNTISFSSVSAVLM